LVNSSALSTAAARRLAGRRPLHLDAGRPFAIKRSVHVLEVDCSPEALAAALREVLAEPGEALGGVVLRRLPERVGRPFEVGERFHGCLTLGGIARAWPLRGLARWVEDRFLSDYAEIVEIEPLRFRYRYLSGTPIAGRSTLSLERAEPGRTRVEATFEFQEVRALALGALHRFALRRHDGAIDAQVRKAAARAGARILESTIPAGYAHA
jgi:hypothetical protein